MIFKKNKTKPDFNFIDFIFVFYFTDFHADLYYFLYFFKKFVYFGFHLLICFSFKVEPKVTDLAFFFFLIQVFEAIKFPLSTAVITPHKF